MHAYTQMTKTVFTNRVIFKSRNCPIGKVWFKFNVF